MPIIKQINGKAPRIGGNVFIAETATIIGDVEIGDNSSIWYGAVLRGDVGAIRIGKNVNVQDGVVMHTTHLKSIVEIGDNVTIGHNATIHGAKIVGNALIGMNSTLLDNSLIEPNCIVAAQALILAGSVCQSGWIYAGVPAKNIKQLSEQQISDIQKSAKNYTEYMCWYKEDI